MPLTIEDGSIVADADSYITVAEYTAWANARFDASRATLPADTAAYEAIILRAMDYFETLSFIGELVEDNQPLQWPRAWAVIDGYSVESREIPKQVKTALYELAYAEEKAEGMSNVIEREVSSEKVGPISISYESGSSSRSVVPSISRTLRKLISGGGGYKVFRS